MTWGLARLLPRFSLPQLVFPLHLLFLFWHSWMAVLVIYLSPEAWRITAFSCFCCFHSKNPCWDPDRRFTLNVEIMLSRAEMPTYHILGRCFETTASSYTIASHVWRDTKKAQSLPGAQKTMEDCTTTLKGCRLLARCLCLQARLWIDGSECCVSAAAVIEKGEEQ